MQFAPHLCSQFPTMRYRGLGALTGQTATIASAAAAGAASTASILVALGTIGGPVGAAIAGLAALGLQLANVFAGCGQTCTEASNLANQAEAILTPMFNTYMASPIHYASMQQAFIASFNSTWSALEQACSNPSLGSAGTNCISQRAAGGCEWKVNAFGWNQINGQWVYTPAGANGSGSTCWNWFTGYLDPIQNDPTVVPDPVASSSTGTAAGTSSLSIAGLSGSQLILPAALLLLLGVLFL